MYFPYLRGRQNELLAIRELVEEDLLHKNIIPIIEPIKLTATYRKTMTYLQDQGRKAYTIINPQVGSYKKNSTGHTIFQDDFDYKYDAILMGDNNITRYVDILQNSERFLEIFKSPDDIGNYSILESEGLVPNYFVITNSRFRRELEDDGKFVLLSDSFERQPRNADYSNNPDRIFSSAHLYYEKENYIGFSDYSITGEEYSEGGFAPRAVAIHIIYFDEDKNLRIKHFVSETNDDITNPAGKFEEALTKLVNWFNNEAEDYNKTKSLTELVKMHSEKRYPGLGYVKKLSLKHHFELISKYFADEE